MSARDSEREVWYHGSGAGAGSRAIVVEGEDGTPKGLLRHVPRHSPTGMSWGYQGSGPADTARSLLIAVLGDDAKCRACSGTRKVTYDPEQEEHQPRPYDPARDPPDHADSGPHASRCWHCDDGYRPLPYQEFKREHVATWGEEWRVSRSQILSWLKEHEQREAGDYPANIEDIEPEAGS